MPPLGWRHKGSHAELSHSDGGLRTRNKKYSTIPEQMLRWRAVKWLIDLHCPEILLGFEFADSAPRGESSLTPRKESRQQFGSQ